MGEQLIWRLTVKTTLNIVITVTFFLELSNAIIIYNRSHFIEKNTFWSFERYKTSTFLIELYIEILKNE